MHHLGPEYILGEALQVRNAASKQIYALGSVTISGVIQAKDTVAINVNGTAYTYTVDAKDTLRTVVEKLVDLINKAPDKNVTAAANVSQLQVVLAAKTPGATGGLVTLTVTTATTSTASTTAAGSTTATTGTPLILAITSGATLNIFLENPSQIAPLTLIQIAGKDLCEGTGSADLTQPYAPTVLNGCSVFIDGMPAPLLSVSPVQIIAQMHGEVLDRSSVSLFARSVRFAQCLRIRRCLQLARSTVAALDRAAILLDRRLHLRLLLF